MSEPSDASSLFDLFREFRIFELKDPERPEAPPTRIGFQKLSYAQNMKLLNQMNAAKTRIEKEYDASDLRKSLMDRIRPLTHDQLVANLVLVEKPTADQVTDLAPGATSPEKEAEALARWEAQRTGELRGMKRDVLLDMLFQRQVALLVQSRVLQEFVDTSLVLMVVNPDTRKPELSLDLEAETSIGNLMPEMRQQLIEFRSEFLEGIGEKAIRKAAETPAFLPSGASPNGPGASPGATIASPSTSPEMSLPSTPSATG
jgi:hypothetical protein